MDSIPADKVTTLIVYLGLLVAGYFIGVSKPKYRNHNGTPKNPRPKSKPAPSTTSARVMGSYT